MSGRSMVSGFEEYLTGYPLPDSTYYAFARTWYAPEMERPGCVWTHTLLIGTKDLAAVMDLGCLRRLFRRPTRGERPGWEEYCQPLEFVEPRAEVAPVPPWQEQSVDLALWGLYGIPDLPLFHPAEDARQLEDIVVALWSQQWPSLRFAFRFCSGAIGVRANAGQPFDYQVIPISSMREVRREVPASSVVASGGWPVAPESPDWLRLASEELRGLSGLLVRKFLWEHAGGGLDGREAFAPLGELYSLWGEARNQSTLPRLLEVIGRRYPEPAGASRLKEAVAGKGFPLARSLLAGTSECDVLRAVSTTPAVAAYDHERLGVEERARTLWEGDRKGAEALVGSLIENDLNPIGERVLLSLIRGMSIEDAIRHSDAIPGLVATAVRLNPDHAKSPAVWKGSPEHQRGLFDAATEGDVPADIQRAIVLAMLQAGSDAAAERAARKFGAVAVDAVMTWFDESGIPSPWDLRDGWRRALAPQTSALLDWLAEREVVRESSEALIADLSNPHSHEVRARGADLWLKVLRDRSVPPTANVRNRLYAFLLALGFDAPAGHPDELVARSFDTVHGALAENRLGEDSWGWLDDQLPTLAVWRHWDRCERLRRGLAERFIRYEWPVANFFRCAPNRGALEKLLKASNKTDGGSRLLKKIRSAVSDDEILLDPESREVVKRYT